MELNLNSALLLLFLYILFRSFDPAYIRELRDDPSLQHRCFAAVVILAGLWSLQAGLQPGLQIHFLGTTALVLIFKWRRALWIASLATVIISLVGLLPYSHAGLFVAGTLLVPLTSGYLLCYLVHRHMPHHLFIYLFLSAFLNAGLCMAIKQFAVTGLLFWGSEYNWQALLDNYLLLTPLLLFPEALLNGMTITLIAVYRPAWLLTFNQADYLNEKR